MVRKLLWYKYFRMADPRRTATLEMVHGRPSGFAKPWEMVASSCRFAISLWNYLLGRSIPG
jgi:hypothetical protein